MPLSAGVAAARASAPDAAVAVSPSFLGLFPVLASARLRRFPWILWLEDILPDAAVTTGLMREGLALRTAQRLEQFIYGSADRIVVISNAFRENLLAKGVPPWKVAAHLQPLHARPRRAPDGAERQRPRRASCTWGTWASHRTFLRWCARSSTRRPSAMTFA